MGLESSREIKMKRIKISRIIDKMLDTTFHMETDFKKYKWYLKNKIVKFIQNNYRRRQYKKRRS